MKLKSISLIGHPLIHIETDAAIAGLGEFGSVGR